MELNEKSAFDGCITGGCMINDGMLLLEIILTPGNTRLGKECIHVSFSLSL